MIQTTLLDAQTRLPELVHKAQLGEKVILTNGVDSAPVAEIVAIEVRPKERLLGLFYNPSFEIPPDFDQLPEQDLDLWNGGGE